MNESSTADHFAEQSLTRLRKAVEGVRRLEAGDPWETEPGDFGRDGWIAIACRKGEQHVAYLRNAGKPWLDRQPKATRDEVDSAEVLLAELRRGAIGRGARVMPSDLPEDPFDT